MKIDFIIIHRDCNYRNVSWNQYRNIIIPSKIRLNQREEINYITCRNTINIIKNMQSLKVDVSIWKTKKCMYVIICRSEFK